MTTPTPSPWPASRRPGRPTSTPSTTAAPPPARERSGSRSSTSCPTSAPSSCPWPAAGWGGLMWGVAAGVKTGAPRVRIVAVQPEASPALPESIRQGRPLLEYPNDPTLADGIAGGIGEIVYEHRDLIDEIVLVSEAE